MSEAATDTRQLIVDTAERIFSDHCDKQLIDTAETGEFADELWQLIASNGFTQLGTSGTTAADLYAFLKACGRFAVPLPLAETLLVNLWLGDDVGVSSIGELVDGRLEPSVEVAPE